MNPHSSERRQFQRIEFDADTRLRQGEREWEVELLDLSLRGLLIRVPQGWQGDPQKPMHVCIELGGDALIEMEAEVARSDGNLFGLACKHIDLDSLAHLHRVLEYNLGEDR
jgi:hypothetical protein